MIYPSQKILKIQNGLFISYNYDDYIKHGAESFSDKVKNFVMLGGFKYD